MIPRRIHFVWIGGELPDWAEHNIAEFHRFNRGHQIHVWGEEAILPELADLCAKLDHPSSKADLVRLSVLWQYGGWYFDVDYWPLRSLNEAVGAWGLDGRRVFITRQDHRRVPFNNCMMASGRGAAGLRELVEAAKLTPPTARTTYGPDLLSAVYARKPGLFTVCGWPWFQPMRHSGAASYYQRAIRGEVEPLRQACAETGGQLPFALHLWLHGTGEAIAKAFREGPDDSPYILVEDCEEGHPIGGAVEGLAALGYAVRRYQKDNERILDTLPHKPAVLVAWNNIRRAKLAESAGRHRVPCLWCENGFYDRKRHMQLDCEGFLHRASWARRIREPAPEGAAERLAAFYPEGIKPMYPREGGYILVLGQVPADTQMAESELQGPLPLQEAVARALPPSVPAYFRPHPSCKQHPDSRHYTLLPELVPGQDEHRSYNQTKAGEGLAEALAGAKFCIAVNSNALVDALAAGVPSLAFGPHLGIAAGVIRRATCATLAADLQAMLDGWRPEQAMVDNFLRWLAARQWTREELATPEVMRALLEEAGAVLPRLTAEREARHDVPELPVAAG